MWTEEKEARATRNEDSEEMDSPVLVPNIMPGDYVPVYCVRPTEPV